MKHLDDVQEMSFEGIKSFLEDLDERKMKEIRFSDALGIVERISELFEIQRDRIDIEDAIGLYEKGMDLLIVCREKLAVVQSKKDEIDKKYRALIQAEQDRKTPDQDIQDD